MRFLYILSCLLVLIQPAAAQLVNGEIRNARTKEDIAYVNIGIPAKGFGLITDENGAFSFKITDEKETDTVRIYSMGYHPYAMTFAQLKERTGNNQPIYLNEMVYQLATTVVRPNDYETEVLGSKNVADLECINLESAMPNDTASLRQYKEKGLNEKSIGIEIGNKIKIDKGQQTFIDRVQFKTCVGPNDTAIYRINVYAEGKTVETHFTPIGVIKLVTMKNVMKEPVIVKTIGKTEVHDLDLSKQNIEVEDDFIIALECIYSSNKQMNIGAKTNVFGSTDLLFRASIMDEWIKVPLLDITFISATVTYKKKHGFFYKLFH